MDKSRAAGNDSPTNASTSSHTNFLGKSVDALNIIKSGKNNNNYSNSTELGADDQSNNDQSDQNVRHNEQYDEDDDATTPVGCFSFIGRYDDTLMKRKKHSLDSKMADTPNPSANLLPLRVAVKTIGAAAYAQDIDDDEVVDDKNRRQFTTNTDFNNVIYDSMFYRNIQKSLDDISIGCQQYHTFEEQNFDRECFMVNPSDDNDYDSSFDAGTSTNQETSFDLSLDELKIYQDEQTNSSSETTSMSRKNSVTFRDDDESAQYSLLSDTLNDSTTIPLQKPQIKQMGHYAIISRVPSSSESNNSNHLINVRNSNISTSSHKGAVPKDKKVYVSWSKWGRKKSSKAEMDEQLLSDDSISSKNYTQV